MLSYFCDDLMISEHFAYCRNVLSGPLVPQGSIKKDCIENLVKVSFFLTLTKTFWSINLADLVA